MYYTSLVVCKTYKLMLTDTINLFIFCGVVCPLCLRQSNLTVQLFHCFLFLIFPVLMTEPSSFNWQSTLQILIVYRLNPLLFLQRIVVCMEMYCGPDCTVWMFWNWFLPKLPAFLVLHQSLPCLGNQERGWNDPPQFSYGLQMARSTQRNLLNKRPAPG